MNKFTGRFAGLLAISLLTAASVRAQGPEPPLKGQALVKAVIALIKEAETLGAPLEKLDIDIDAVAIGDLTCTFKKADEWLANGRKALAEVKKKQEQWKQAEAKLKTPVAELQTRLDAFKKLVKDQPEAADNPIAGLDVLLEAAQEAISSPMSRIEASRDYLSDLLPKFETNHAEAKRCKV